MSKPKNKKTERQILAEEFLEALELNEEDMPEGAAMALTCEEFDIDEEEGYDLLAELAMMN